MHISVLSSLLFLIAAIAAPVAFAVGVFDVLPTDKSQEYLSILFGGNVGLVNLGGDANPMLSKMFERFNFIIVSVGITILAYIGVAAAINTAREGEAMGKKFSLWVPLRAMFGMLLMIPSPGTGYSIVQMTVIWVVLNGIGAANTIWNVVLDQLATGIKATGTIDVPLDANKMANLAYNVLNSATCMQVVNNIPNLPLTQQYGPVKLTTNFHNPVVTASGGTQRAVVSVGVAGSPNSDDHWICGRYQVDTEIIKGDRNNTLNASTLAARLNIKVNALLAMFSVLEPAANQLRLVTPRGAPVGTPDPPPPDLGYIQKAIDAYKAQAVNLGGGIRKDIGFPMFGPDLSGATQATGQYIKQAWEQTNDAIPIASAQVAAFKRLGWIHAGSYYYAMSKSSAAIDQDALKPAEPTDYFSLAKVPQNTLDDPNIKSLPGIWPKNLFVDLNTPPNRYTFNEALQRAIEFSKKDKPGTISSLPAIGSGKVSSGDAFIDRILTPISDSVRAILIKLFKAAVTGQNQDPLISIGKFGWELMMSGELGIFTAIIIAFGISMAVSPASCMNPAAFAGNQLLLQVFLLIFTFLALVWGLGASMGVYLPLIPYLVFTGTAVGWLLAVIEAVVAAPLIALSMVQPGGEELGSLKQPLLMLLNLFLRPMLMIFGFVLAASFLRAILDMITFGFTRVVEESVSPTLFAVIPILGIFAGLIIAMTNVAFSLIYELPNKLMRFMGFTEGGGFGGKVEGMVQEAKKSADEGIRTAEGGVKMAGGASQGFMKHKFDSAKGKFEDQQDKQRETAREAQRKKAFEEAVKAETAKKLEEERMKAREQGGGRGQGGEAGDAGRASGGGAQPGVTEPPEAQAGPSGQAPGGNRDFSSSQWGESRPESGEPGTPPEPPTRPPRPPEGNA